MKKLLFCLSATFILILIGVSSQAATTYMQLPSETNFMAYASNPNEVSGRRVADDFTLSSASTITAVQWWGFDEGGGWSGTSSFDGFTFTFYADNNGTPGDVSLAIPVTLTSATVDTEYSPDYASNSVWAYSADISASLNAGTYWLSIFDKTSDSDWGWMVNDGVFSYQQIDGEWFKGPTADEMYSNAAFGITYAPVPLPSAVWLLGSGLVALVALGRRRSTK